MPDDEIIACPMTDRTRVANAIQRGVRLHLHPVHAKAAVHGMPVELTYEQAADVADVALEALAKTHPGAQSWLIEANKGLRERGEVQALRWKALLAQQRGTTNAWRAATVNSWAWMAAWGGYWEWHWSRWIVASVLVAGTAVGLGLRRWLMRREQRKAAEQ